ncbi:glycosyltransferase family 4 protein [Qipengyuania zhejiangensis]|uniref:glycosyltransferase family 4 protein n=1 Tax=Qipengyuania zhejiangensis TaxID=3077782 RepID=UPI002D7788FC|nr:glycosyltransferase family 4 protein [Qipengyuania sp. Z2]
MRIAFILAGMGAGGAERVVSVLAAELIERGHDITVVAFDAPEDRVYHPLPAEVRLIRLGVAKGGGRLMRGIGASIRRTVRLRSFLKQDRPDVVLSFLTKVNVLTLLASRGLDLKVVISERNNPAEQGAHPAWSWAWKKLAPCAATVVLQTEAIKSIYPPAIARKAVVIPNPVEVPQELRARPDSKVVVGVGRLTHQKGFDRLIDAFARVADDHPSWRLIIWGEGPLRQQLERQASRTGLADRITFPGVSDRPAGWIEDTGIYVLSSRYEGFPNALLEAMQGGLPVIAFDCPYGPADIVTDHRDGLLVPEGDVDLLGQAIGKLMANREISTRFAASAREKAAHYAPSQIVSKWECVMSRLYTKG